MKTHATARVLPTLATAAALVLGATSAHAHPGHGLHEATAWHVLSNPYHLAVLAFVGVVLLLAGRFVQRRLPRRVLQGAAIVTLATATVLWGLRN